jgi:hypothetical protein
MSGKKENKKLTIERVFAGTEKLEDLLMPLVIREIDKLVESSYDNNMASATPKGVANQ